MTLLSEQERLISSEISLINVATQYTASGSAWSTTHDYGNIVLAAAGIVVFTFLAGRDGLGAGTGYMRLKVGSLYCWGKTFAIGASTTAGVAVWLAAGTYGVLMESYGGTSGGVTYVSGFKCGFCKFNDAVGSALAAYSSTALTVASRNTPIGALTNTHFCVQLFALTPTSLATNFEDINESLTNGVSVLIDGVQVSSIERNQDADGKYCASAKYFINTTVGTQHTVTVSLRNVNTQVTMSIVACPWILSSASIKPVDPLEVSQGSTIYLTKEPLFLNATGYIYVGQARAISYGDSNDYYYLLSGVDILSGSYTFEMVSVVDIDLSAKGLGCCVSIIAVDIR
jgi:hypothetical protein